MFAPVPRDFVSPSELCERCPHDQHGADKCEHTRCRCSDGNVRSDELEAPESRLDSVSTCQQRLPWAENGLADLRTPYAITIKRRITAAMICLGRLPLARSRPANAESTGLQRIAVMAGM